MTIEDQIKHVEELVQALKGNAPENLWIGTSVENQATADERIPHLLKCPAKIRFISAEPLLGPIDFSKWISSRPSLHQIIVGGESGPGARPMHPDWARSIRDQCQAAGVPFFFKQWGEFVPWDAGNCPTDQAEWILAHDKCALRTRMMPDGSVPKAGSEMSREEMDRYMRDGVHMLRVGKKVAGRILDGRTWDEFPDRVSCSR